MLSYSANGIKISETLQTNAIAWIHSLPEPELGPTRRILEDLEGLAGAGGFPVHKYAVGTRAELIGTLSRLRKEAENGLRPVLHVDAHGDVERGLLLSPSGEHMGWVEVINLLRELNVATRNNLASVFALCFGLHLYKHASLTKPVPAYIFFAPPSEVSVGFLEAQTLAFYREVNRTANVTEAFQATLGGRMQSFHCQGLFLLSLLRYIRTYCMGRRRQDRLERMVTAIITREGITKPSSSQLREIRQKIRDSLEPGQDLIDRFAPSFLIGRTPAFTYSDVAKILAHSGAAVPPRSL